MRALSVLRYRRVAARTLRTSASPRPIEYEGATGLLPDRQVSLRMQRNRFSSSPSQSSVKISKSVSGPLETYYKLTTSGEIAEDKNQVKLMERLQQLHDEILQYESNGLQSISKPLSQNAPKSADIPPTESKASASWFDVFFSPNDNKQNAKMAKDALVSATASKHSVGRSSSPASRNNVLPQSVYVHGGTGCGKTFMMDLFFESLPIKKKKRVHFNNFMIDIHKRLHRLRQQQAAVAAAAEGRDDIVSYTGNNTLSPLTARALVTKSQRGGVSSSVGGATGGKTGDTNSAVEAITDDLMEEAYVLCFDEFQVTDIADAMILKSLFESMFNKGAVLVATSNRPPNDLYKNGIQRDLFIPFIHLLGQQADVVSLVHSKVDYRLVKSHHQAMNMYLSPIDQNNIDIFEEQFVRLSESLHIVKTELKVYGHVLQVSEAVVGRRMAKFSFKSLCDEALGASDYIQLGQSFTVIFLSDIPVLNPRARNEMRRFITLVDALYEANVMVVFLAEAAPLSLLQITDEERVSYHDDEIFAFDRTVSRLLEMRSEAYRAALREKRPERAGGPKTLHKLLSVRAALAPVASAAAGQSAIVATISDSKAAEAPPSNPVSVTLIPAPPATVNGILDLFTGKNTWSTDAATSSSSDVNRKGRRIALRTIWQQYNWMKGKEENILLSALTVLADDLKVLGVQLPVPTASVSTNPSVKDTRSFEEFLGICARASPSSSSSSSTLKN